MTSARFIVANGGCLQTLWMQPSNYYDALLSDPPAGIGFMGKGWDKDKGGRDKWIKWCCSIYREAFRCLKPGAYGLIWALPRTQHWTMTALENAGFEIRDTVLFLFGTGMPKSYNISKAIDRRAGAERPVIGHQTLTGNAAVALADKGGTYGVQVGTVAPKTIALTGSATEEAKRWDGYGTGLAPAHEAWVLIRKPLEGVIVDNASKWGTGAINIDGARIGRAPDDQSGWSQTGSKVSDNIAMSGANSARDPKPDAPGRWPKNVALDEFVADVLDAQAGDCPGMSGGGTHRDDYGGGMFGSIDCAHTVRGDFGGPSRFLYCAKPSSRERDFGCEDFDVVSAAERVDREEGSAGMNNPRAGAGRTGGAANNHATIKGVALTKWLATLILPPPHRDGSPRRLLSPFAGSGGEMIGGLRAGFEELYGIERDERFCAIARARLTRWAQVQAHVEPKDVDPNANADERQLGLFE